MQKVWQGRISEHLDHNENEHRASLEKGNVDAESVILRRRPKAGREVSNTNSVRCHRGIGDGMDAKGTTNQHGKPSAVGRETSTGDPRGSDQAARGDGEVRSSEETSNDRGAKGP
jgi:hypothetical protein